MSALLCVVDSLPAYGTSATPATSTPSCRHACSSQFWSIHKLESTSNQCRHIVRPFA